MQELISVIIPTFNAEKTITVAIDSILKQTYKNLEVIVVDDHSTDNTALVVQNLMQCDPRIQYFFLNQDDPNRYNRRGVNINAGWMARNFGVDQAHGQWITFQDADDASLLNRIEVQYQLAQQFQSSHVCIDWQKFDESLLNTTLDIHPFLEDPNKIVRTNDILNLIKKTKGIAFTFIPKIHRFIPFILKRKKPLGPLFFRAWDSYPCTAGCPLVKKEIFDCIRFQPLSKRVWPSARGRGTDRDFNFHVAEYVKNSLCVKIPLYLWRVQKQNSLLSLI